MPFPCVFSDGGHGFACSALVGGRGLEACFRSEWPCVTILIMVVIRGGRAADPDKPYIWLLVIIIIIIMAPGGAR